MVLLIWMFCEKVANKYCHCLSHLSNHHQTQIQSSWYNLVAQEETNTCESQPWKPIGLHSGDFCDKGDLVLQLSWAGGWREKRKKKNHPGSLWLSYFADLLKRARGRKWLPEVRISAKPSCGCRLSCANMASCSEVTWGNCLQAGNTWQC